MKPIAAAAVLFVPLALASCGDDGSGPERREPTSIQLSDAAIEMDDGDTVQVTVSVFDQDGEPFATLPEDVELNWSTQTPTIVTVLSDGRVIALHPGAGQIRVSTDEGLIANATVQVNQVPTQVVIVSGDAQDGLPNTPLEDSVVVRVRDRHGDAVPGVQVAFSVSSGGGSVSPVTAMTDNQGRARTQWTLGPVIGDQEIEAELAGTSASISIGATISQVVFAGVDMPTTVTQGAALAGSIRVDSNLFPRAIGAAHVVVTWDPSKLQLQGGSLDSGDYARSIRRFDNATGELHLISTDPDVTQGERAVAGLAFDVVGGAGTTTTIGLEIEQLVDEAFNSVAAGVASDLDVTIN